MLALEWLGRTQILKGFICNFHLRPRINRSTGIWSLKATIPFLHGALEIILSGFEENVTPCQWIHIPWRTIFQLLWIKVCTTGLGSKYRVHWKNMQVHPKYGIIFTHKIVNALSSNLIWFSIRLPLPIKNMVTKSR